VVDYTPGIDEIEARICEGQILGIPLLKLGAHAEKFQAAARVRHCALGQVDPREERPSFGESLVICAEPDANLEHTLPARALERGKLLDVRLKFIPSACLLEISLPS
jgi:hypothetical protein